LPADELELALAGPRILHAVVERLLREDVRRLRVRDDDRALGDARLRLAFAVVRARGRAAAHHARRRHEARDERERDDPEANLSDHCELLRETTRLGVARDPTATHRPASVGARGGSLRGEKRDSPENSTISPARLCNGCASRSRNGFTTRATAHSVRR